MTLIVYVICVLFVGSTSLCDEEYFRRLDALTPESPCSRAGGSCIFAEDCPPELRADDGLCPKQRNNGVECCYGLSVKETRCQKRGGECKPSSYCNERLIQHDVKDCPKDTQCCTLV